MVLFDHQVPADSLKAAENHIMLRRFAQEQGILNYDIFCGVCHQVMPEKGHVLPGSIVVGTDSHTCTYGAWGLLPQASARRICPPSLPQASSGSWFQKPCSS